MHERLMLLLYNRVKATSILHSITELSDSEEEYDNSDVSEDEGFDMELEDDFNMDTSVKGTRKGKDKDMTSGSSRKTSNKRVKGIRNKMQEEDNWFEEDDEDDDDMDTESENATPPPKKKTKCSPVITEISPKEEDGTSKTPSTPLDPNRRTCSVEKEGKNVVEDVTLPPKDKITVVDVETLENNVVFS
ncbi:uncharacterized protein LOC131039346 [Cryptomeria japonica]|uniref:uncharacterized protein LOC131039346 n=1 Tax=Cryptomeria japonica TaxID=3369 RepID=UPI0027DA0C83|nr:uncharacterized protein LOC131039346 [Cryptomeria japonica]